jgi:anti-sigma factor RsiW
MTGGRRFAAPDWGPDHLSLDAIVAYVDDELTAGPHARAQAHLAACAECHAEVVAQRQTRAALRAADCPRLPSSLLHSLRCIPVEAELPPPPAGLGVTADGQFVLLRDVPGDTPGPVTSPPGDALPGAASEAGRSDTGRSDTGLSNAARSDPGPSDDGARRFSWLARVGAVSGLAVGALAVGALTLPDPLPNPVSPVDPGFIGGAVLDVPAPDVPAPDVPGRAGPIVVPAAVPTDVSTGPAPRTSSAAPDVAAVLDARVRARLDGSPIAFHHHDR